MADGPRFFRAYGVGLIYASVCTDMTDQAAERELNRQHPTGLRHGWFPAQDSHFATGEPNPFPCPDGEGRRHVLFTC